MNEVGSGSWRAVAFLASAAAAGIHFAATHEHMEEYVPAGSFMLVAGLLQLAWAVWVWRGTEQRGAERHGAEQRGTERRGTERTVLRAGAAANLAIVGVWLVSRTVGLPWGEMPWTPEHIDGPDLLATALEILIVVAAVRLLTGEAPAPRSLLHVAWVGALTACILAAHDPAREQLTAFATIAGAFVMRAFVAVAPRAIAQSLEGRHDEEVTYRVGIRARRVVDSRPGLDASR